MFWTRNKDVPLKGGEEPVSDWAEISAIVTKITLSPMRDGRNAAILTLYSNDPVMVNGETEHEFQVYIPNYDTYPPFSMLRMKFWACYGYRQPVELDEENELIVPMFDESAGKNFINCYMKFSYRVLRISKLREVVEIGFIKR